MSETRQPNEDTRELDDRVSALIDQMQAASNRMLRQIDETDPYPPSEPRPDLFNEPTGPAEQARAPDAPAQQANGTGAALEAPAPPSPPPAPPPPGPPLAVADDLSRAVDAMIDQARAVEPPRALAPPAPPPAPLPPAPTPPPPQPPTPRRPEPVVSAGTSATLDDELAIFGDDLFDDADPKPVQSHRPAAPATPSSTTSPISAPPRPPTPPKPAEQSPLRTMPLAAAVASTPVPVRPAAPRPAGPPSTGKGLPVNTTKPSPAGTPRPAAPASTKPAPRPATPPQPAPRKPLARAAGAVAPVVLKTMDAASAPVRHKPNARRIAGYVAVITAFNALCLLAYNFLIREPRPPASPPGETSAQDPKKGGNTNDAGVEVSPRSKVKPAARRKMMGSGGD